MQNSFNGKQTLNLFKGGIDMDSDYMDVQQTSYLYSENIRITVDKNSGNGVLQAVEGFTKLSENIEYEELYYNADNSISKRYGLFSLNKYKIIGISIIRDYACIFTKNLELAKRNAIFRLRLEGDEIKLSKISENYFNINNDEDKDLSITSRWEDFDNIKVYWADGTNPLRFINIAESKDIDNFSKTTDYFESNHNNNLSQPELNKFTSGSLKIGMIQYCYQLFNKNGSETNISPLSPIYHLTKSSFNSINYKGASVDTNSGKSINIKFKIDSDNFNICRVYSLHYKQLNQIPEIKIVSEFSINATEGYQYFSDPGSYISVITYNEFVALNPYYFIPKVIESKDDRLFAANIVEDSWSLPNFEEDGWYDTRAFRFSKNDPTPHAKLLSNSGPDKFISPQDTDLNFLSNSEWKKLLPEKEDCINPINTNLLIKSTNIDSDYEHYYDKTIQQITDKGGTGRNVSFKIIHTKFGEDSLTSIPPRMDTLTTLRESLFKGMVVGVDIRNDLKRRVNQDGSKELRLNTLDLYYNIPSVNNQNYISSPNRLVINNVFNQFDRINYGNPILDARYRSYQRDELYRFGAVFYNEKGQQTPVNWIADIRMPSMLEHEHRLFDQTGGIKTDVNTFNVFQVVTYPMGIQFFFENLPDDVKQIEIVRCERKLEDRSIVTQGIVGKAVRETGRAGDVSNNVNKVRPLPIMTYSNSFGSSLLWLSDTRGTDAYTIDTSYDNVMPSIGESGSIPYVINSPEISYFGESITDYFSNININLLYGLSSPTNILYGNDTLDNDLIKRSGDSYIFNSQYWFNDFESTLKNKYSSENGRVFTNNSRSYLVTTASSRDDIKKFEDKVKLVGKLYNPFTVYSDNSGNKIDLTNIDGKEVTDSKLAQNINYLKYTDVKNGLFSQNVGSDTFQNWTVDMDFNSDNIFDKQVKTGPNGASVYIKSVDITNSLPSISSIGSNYSSFFNKTNLYIDKGNSNTILDRSKSYATGSTFLVNVKKSSIPYNGLDYAGRSNSTYISTSFIQNIDSPNTNIIVFGGDTYIGINEYINQHWFYLEEDPKDDEDKTVIGRRSQVVYYYPCESSINHSLVHGSSFFRFANDNTFPHDIEYTIGVRPYGFTQESPLYAYNSVYSTENKMVSFLPKGMYSEDHKNIDYRVVYSEAKTNDEISDNWLKFKPANYLDVDTRFGSINNLKLFNNTLYFWQDNSFGALSVNPRSLIDDSNPGSLILGKGDVLSSYSYVTNKNGSKENVLNNICITPSSLYWYDHKRAEILSYGESLTAISKTKNIQSYFNENKNNINDKINTLYDKKYNEVHFDFKIDSNSDIKDHIIFNEQVGAFTSFYTYNSDWFIDFQDNYYSFKNNLLYKHNSSKQFNKFYENISEESIVKILTNENYTNTKVFDNVEYAGDFDESGFTSISFKTKNQVSDEVDRIDLREDNYRFSIPRNTNPYSNESTIAPSFKDRMRGKYIEGLYKYKPKDTDRVFKIPYIKTSYRISNI